MQPAIKPDNHISAPPSIMTRHKPNDPERRASAVSSSGNAERLKIIVRRLPSTLPEEVFWQSVQAWVTEETVTWKSFVQGKVRKRCVSCGNGAGRSDYWDGMQGESGECTVARVYAVQGRGTAEIVQP